jgi:hypothetical protein
MERPTYSNADAKSDGLMEAEISYGRDKEAVDEGVRSEGQLAHEQ